MGAVSKTRKSPSRIAGDNRHSERRLPPTPPCDVGQDPRPPYTPAPSLNQLGFGGLEIEADPVNALGPCLQGNRGQTDEQVQLEDPSGFPRVIPGFSPDSCGLPVPV